MIRYFMRRRKDRFRLIVPLVIWFALCWLTGGAWGETPVQKPSHWLKEVRDGQVQGHYTLVFIFSKSFSFKPPVVKENEALITFGDTGTALPPFRQLRSFNSSLRLEKKDADLEARIAIPKGFSRMTYERAKGPERLIIHFSREEDAAVPAAAAIPPPRGNPQELTVGGVIPNTENLKTFHDPARAVVKPPPPPEPPVRRSYNFQDIDIRQALSALAQDQDINLIMSTDVTGKITALLHQVILEEAIRGITMAGGFTFRKEDDSYYVYKPKDIRDPQSDTGIIRAPVAASPEGPTKLIYNFQDLDIRQALSALAKEQNINVIIAPEVTGKITVHLNQINVEEAIHAITMAGGFTYNKQDELYYVYKPKAVLDPEAERLQIRIFHLNFAAIDKVQEILTAIPGMRTIRLHEPSKTIIVEDTPENIAKIEKIIKSWDVAPRQVLIEARIMQVSLTDDMSLGVDWQKIFGDLTIGTAGFTAGLPVAGLPVMPTTGLGASIITAAGSRDQFMAALNALQVKTRVDTLSTPKILALHGKPSRVQVGGRQGYKTSTSTLGVVTETVSFLDTGTILDITPYIDDAGNVLLDVKPQINSVTFDATGTPNQKTTTVSTSMLAKNGQTMFIGGLIEDTKNGIQNALPCLGSIPGLGLLFGSMSNSIGKSELIVLITPQIIDPEKPNTEGLEKIRQMEDKLKKEPLSLPGRLLQKFP